MLSTFSRASWHGRSRLTPVNRPPRQPGGGGKLQLRAGPGILQPRAQHGAELSHTLIIPNSTRRAALSSRKDAALLAQCAPARFTWGRHQHGYSEPNSSQELGDTATIASWQPSVSRYPILLLLRGLRESPESTLAGMSQFYRPSLSHLVQPAVPTVEARCIPFYAPIRRMPVVEGTYSFVSGKSAAVMTAREQVSGRTAYLPRAELVVPDPGRCLREA